MTLGAAAVPCTAGDATAAKARREAHPPVPREPPGLLATARAGGAPQRAASPRPTPSSPSSFFKSTRGKVTLALMGAGVGFTLWSIQSRPETGQVPDPLEGGMALMKQVFRTAAALLLAAIVATPALAQSLDGLDHRRHQGRTGRRAAGRDGHADRQAGHARPR